MRGGAGFRRSLRGPTGNGVRGPCAAGSLGNGVFPPASPELQCMRGNVGPGSGRHRTAQREPIGPISQEPL